MTRRLLLHALVLGLIAATTTTAQAGPPDLEQIVRERAAAHAVDGDYLASVAGCESRWDVYAVGARGELGLFQLAPWGELRRFYAEGYADPFNAWEASDFAARRFAAGGSSAWSCA